MFATLKSAVELIEKWRTSGDLPYQMVAGVGSLVTLAAIGTGGRPSQLVSRFFEALGAGPVARSFGSDAPPFLATASVTVQQTTLSLAAMLFAVMVVVPLWRARHGYDDAVEKALGLIGARAAATFWLAVLVAVQQGPITTALQDAMAAGRRAALWGLALMAFAGVVYLLARRWGLDGLLELAFRPLGALLARALITAGAAIAAIVLVPAAVPLMVASWLGALESESSRRSRQSAARTITEATPLPTGAISLPRRPARFTPPDTEAVRRR